MNTAIIVLGSALAATATTLSVITIQRPEMVTGESRLVALTEQLVSQHDQFLREQEFLRSNLIEMVEAQQEMLHRDKQGAATLKRQNEQADEFFRKNMGLDR